MKRLFMLMFCCVLLILAAACSSNKNDDLFTIENKLSGTELKLGMSRSEAEALLGTDYVSLRESQGGAVGFSDETADLFPADIDQSLIYCIDFGSTETDAETVDYLYVAKYSALRTMSFDYKNMLALN